MLSHTLSAQCTRALLMMIGTLMMLGNFSSPAFAQETHYTDVPPGAYYEGAAAALLSSGALDPSELRLRPRDLATRAEVLKLLVHVYGTELLWPAQSSFSDVPRSAWYFPYVEAAARAGWIHGDNNCYQTGRTACTARPASRVNRAEMAAMLQRAFRLPRLGLAPTFPDNRNNSVWYFVPIQTAADHCILQGDELTGLVRPAASMNRAEMVVMFDRASQQQRYGQDCAEPVGNILGVTALSARHLRVTFNVDLDPNRMGSIQRYTVEEIGGTRVDIADSAVLNARTVELTLGGSLRDGITYRLRVEGMRTENGAIFSDVQTFTFESVEGDVGHISEVLALSPTRLRVIFDREIDNIRAEQATRYSVTDGTSDPSVRAADLLSDLRTAELTLASPLRTQTAYVLRVNDMLTARGTPFSDTDSFVYDAGSATFSATLTGAQEVPPVSTAGTGSGTFVLTTGGLQYHIRVRSLTGSVTAAHFHRGAAGVSGPVVFTIAISSSGDAAGTWTGITDDLRNALLDREIYVNVHTTRYPDGEVRGQVLPK